MNPDQSTPTLEESIRQVMQTLPLPIRNFLTQGKSTMVAKGLITKYGLRLDQGGILERELMLLLMGIDNPSEFAQALAEEARLSPQTVSSIMQDVNVQVFAPLREQMRNVSGSTQQPVKTTPPRPPVSMPAPKYYAPPPQSPAYARPNNAFTPSPLVSKIAPLPPKSVLPRPAEAPDTTSAFARKRTGPINLLANNQPQAIPITPSVQATVSAPTSPSATPAPTPSRPQGAATPLQQALRSVLPPKNLPGQTPPTPDILPPVSKAPPQPYPADPYREPIE